MGSQAVRARYAQQFNHLEKPGSLQAVLILVAYVLQIGLSVVAGFLLLGIESATATLLVVPCMVFIATRFRGLNNIVHECSHLSFTGKKSLNLLLGRIAAAFILKSFHQYRIEHMTHHKYLGSYALDLDFSNLKRFRLEEPLTARVIARHILIPLTGLHIRYYFGVSLSLRDGYSMLFLKGLLIAGVLIITGFEPLLALLCLVVPYGWIYPAINYWTDCIDHGGLLQSKDNTTRSRNWVVPKWLRVIFFPRNDCFHLIHHLFPSVPVSHFDECYNRLYPDHCPKPDSVCRE